MMKKQNNVLALRNKAHRFLWLPVVAGLALTMHQGMSQSPVPGEAKVPEGFTIGVEVNMVTVPVTVRHAEGGFVKGLSKESFVIHE
ncbi:MAG TPA: hypothetical protein VLL97_08680, partial [Acidobacteriota bacterium]|nr:hypothetical protein [Acidobacteriota bacterium]